MSLFENEERDTRSFFNFILRNHKKLLFSFILGALVAGSVSLLLPKKYTSTGIIYPPNSYTRDQLIDNPQFGTVLDVEYLMQLLESASLRNKVIDRFNLGEYYKLDTTVIEWRSKATLQFVDDVEFTRSKYLSIVVSANTKDPELSADIVNYIIDEVNEHKQEVTKENVESELRYFENRYFSALYKTDSLKSLIYSMKDTTKASNILSNFFSSLNKENEPVALFIDNPQLEKLVSLYSFEHNQLNGKKLDYTQAKDRYEKPHLNNYVVDRAVADYQKTSPKNAINTLLGAFLSLLATMVFLGWKELSETNRA